MGPTARARDAVDARRGLHCRTTSSPSPRVAFSRAITDYHGKSVGKRTASVRGGDGSAPRSTATSSTTRTRPIELSLDSHAAQGRARTSCMMVVGAASVFRRPAGPGSSTIPPRKATRRRFHADDVGTRCGCTMAVSEFDSPTPCWRAPTTSPSDMAATIDISPIVGALRTSAGNTKQAGGRTKSAIGPQLCF